MARPIAPTPTLKGEDAKRFIEAAKNPKPFPPPRVDAEKLVEHVRAVILLDKSDEMAEARKDYEQYCEFTKTELFRKIMELGEESMIVTGRMLTEKERAKVRRA